MDKLQLAEENELAPKFLEAGREKIDSGPKDLIERLEIPTPFEEGVPFEKVFKPANSPPKKYFFSSLVLFSSSILQLYSRLFFLQKGYTSLYYPNRS